MTSEYEGPFNAFLRSDCKVAQTLPFIVAARLRETKASTTHHRPIQSIQGQISPTGTLKAQPSKHLVLQQTAQARHEFSSRSGGFENMDFIHLLCNSTVAVSTWRPRGQSI